MEDRKGVLDAILHSIGGGHRFAKERARIQHKPISASSESATKDIEGIGRWVSHHKTGSEESVFVGRVFQINETF
jgi:hypothetical protein